MTTKCCSIVSNDIDIVEELTFDGLEHENIALLELRLILCRSLVLGQLLEVLLGGRYELSAIDGQSSSLRVHKDVHAFRATTGGRIGKD